MYALKPIAREDISSALERAERYRLMNEPKAAEISPLTGARYLRREIWPKLFLFPKDQGPQFANTSKGCLDVYF